jgi:hypothetical protein
MNELTWAVAITQAVSTLAMTGLIWFVQIVHYPLFRRIGEDKFAAYEKEHEKRTSFVVGPLMLLEAASAVALVLLLPGGLLAWAGVILLAIIWLSTFTLQVPQHRKLEKGFDHDAHSFLVTTNWIRTLSWSARSVMVLVILAEGI